MGFVPPTTVYRLEFEGHYAGLEVRMRAARLGIVFDTQGLMDIDPANVRPEDAEKAARLIELVADHLASWNVETEDGTPVPASLEGLKAQEMPMIGLLFSEWQRAMTEVPGPLSRPSSSGAPPESLSLPMEPLSPASLAG